MVDIYVGSYWIVQNLIDNWAHSIVLLKLKYMVETSALYSCITGTPYSDHEYNSRFNGEQNVPDIYTVQTPRAKVSIAFRSCQGEHFAQRVTGFIPGSIQSPLHWLVSFFRNIRFDLRSVNIWSIYYLQLI